MQPLTLDLHDIYADGQRIDVAVGRVVREAVERRIPLIEIISHRDTSHLRRRVIRFLNQPHMRYYCDHIEANPRHREPIRVFVRA